MPSFVSLSICDNRRQKKVFYHHCEALCRIIFNPALLKDLKVWTACLRSCHSTSTGFKSRLWLGISNRQLLTFFSHKVLHSFSCWIKHVCSCLKSRTGSRKVFFKIFLLLLWRTEFIVLYITESHPEPGRSKNDLTHFITSTFVSSIHRIV